MKFHFEVSSIILDKFCDQVLNLMMTTLFNFLPSHSHIILPLEEHRRRWEDNVKMVLKEMRCNSMGSSHMVQCSCEHSLMNDHEREAC
jgi:hypothetical protein